MVHHDRLQPSLIAANLKYVFIIFRFRWFHGPKFSSQLCQHGRIVALIHGLLGGAADLLHVLNKTYDDLRQGGVPAWGGILCE